MMLVLVQRLYSPLFSSLFPLAVLVSFSRHMWASVWCHTSTHLSACTFRLSPTFLILLSIRMMQSSRPRDTAGCWSHSFIVTGTLRRGALTAIFGFRNLLTFLQDRVIAQFPTPQPGGPQFFCRGVLPSATVTRHLKAPWKLAFRHCHSATVRRISKVIRRGGVAYDLVAERVWEYLRRYAFLLGTF